MTDNTENLWRDNLEFLRCHASPNSVRAVEKGAVEVSDLIIGSGESGVPEFSCRRDDDDIVLHSRRHPGQEAARQVEGCELAGKTGIVVLGMAGGYHLDALAEQMPSGGIMLIIDLFPGRVAAAMQRLNLSNWEKHGVIPLFIVNTGLETIRREFRQLLKKQPHCDFAFFAHPGLMRLDSRPWQLLTVELREEIRLETADRITRAALADEWLANAVDALPMTLAGPQIDALTGCFSGGTALLAAAGPTLTQALPMLRRMSAHCPVFAVGTAVRPLLAGGIVPDMVVCLDSDRMTVDQIPEAGLETAFLAAAYSTPSSLNSRFPSRTFSYSFSGLKGFNAWLEKGERKPPLLNVGGTVSLTAIDLALLTGCTTVILCGLDLAMSDNGTTHAQDSVYDGCRLPPEKLVEVSGNCRDKVLTTRQFSGYIRQMNAYLSDVSAGGKVKFFNATTGGAMLEKTTVVNPEILNDDMVRHRIGNAKAVLAAIYAAEVKRSPALPHWQNYLRQSAVGLKALNRLAEEALAIVAASPQDRSMPQEKMEILTALEREIRRTPELALLDQALESVTLAVYSPGSGSAKDKSACLYHGIAEAAEQLADRLTTVEEKLCQMIK